MKTPQLKEENWTGHHLINMLFKARQIEIFTTLIVINIVCNNWYLFMGHTNMIQIKLLLFMYIQYHQWKIDNIRYYHLIILACEGIFNILGESWTYSILFFNIDSFKPCKMLYYTLSYPMYGNLLKTSVRCDEPAAHSPSILS